MKRVIIANDLPGVGKVALAAAMPLMAACQIEAAPLPTVLLSSHTAGFSPLFSDDYSRGMAEILKIWQDSSYSFDGLVAGYLRSKEQIRLLLDFLERKPLPLFLDPIMADNGSLYQGFTNDQVSEMRRLSRQADLIIPNLTEAALLTETPYLEEGYHPQAIEDLLEQLSQLGPSIVILTGVSFESGKIGLAISQKGQVTYLMSPAYPDHFYGTGDVLTSILAAAYFQGVELIAAAKLALAFLDKSLQTTLALNRDLKFGLCFEPHLGDFIRDYQRLLEERDEKRAFTSVY